MVAVIAVLIGILLPALARSRDAARGTGCLSNLRQMFVACRSYALDHDGVGPAIGQPYGGPSNWALVVQRAAGREGRTAGELYATSSVLVCPSSRALLGADVTRTYAMNATGHAGAPGDEGDFDSLTTPGHINFDRVPRPSETPLLMDSAPAPVVGNAPPPTRTTSVIDFRNAAHVPARLGFVHGGRDAASGGRFQWGAFDGSASAASRPREHWVRPLTGRP